MTRSLEFYCDVLGFEKTFGIDDDAGEPWLNYLKICDGQFLELFFGGSTRGIENQQQEELQYLRSQRLIDSKAVGVASMPSGYLHLCLEVEDIFKIAGHLKARGIKLDIEPKMGKDLNYQCWARDPDGNRIEFMQIDPRSPQARTRRS